MSTNLLGELAANNGTYYLTESVYEGSIDQIIVRGEGVVIDAIYVIRDGVSVNVFEDYCSSPYLANGLRITPKNDEVFSRVNLAAAPQGSGLELVLA
jgi:hypothetical protein